jgi:hypothetical protein
VVTQPVAERDASDDTRARQYQRDAQPGADGGHRRPVSSMARFADVSPALSP